MKQQGDARAVDVGAAVRAALMRVAVLRSGGTVVVATSGGADSLCLLHVLHGLSTELRLSLHVAHLDHMLRGEESRDDARYVRDQTASLGLPCTVEARDAAAYRELNGRSMEESAREVRYSFLLDVARSAGADAVATGHTRDDAVETVLLHILRGTGIHGLRGLEPVSPFPLPAPGTDAPPLLRPLLEVSRGDTVEYCRRHGLEPREDSSNASMEYLRNRIRLELLPSMRTLNPRVDEALLRLSGIAAEDDDFVSAAARELRGRISSETEDGVSLALDGFVSAPPPVQSRLVFEIISHLSGGVRDVSAEHIAAVRAVAASATGKRVELPCGVTWLRERDALLALLRDAGGFGTRDAMPESALELHVPGEVELSGGRITARLERPGEAVGSSSRIARVDAELTGDVLHVRRRRPGDRFRPFGMSEEKKLQDFMVDEHIPARERDAVPIVCSTSHIVWVVGHRVDDRVKTSANTQHVLRLELVRDR